MLRVFSRRIAAMVVAGVAALTWSGAAASAAFSGASSKLVQQASPKHMKRVLVRPKILGISHVAFYAADAAKSDRFYEDVLGLAADATRAHVFHVGAQAIEIEALPANEGDNRLSHVAFATDDAERMREFLAGHGVAVPDSVHREVSGTVWFALKDPEGHPIEFVEEKSAARTDVREKDAEAVSRRIIHAGVVVRDRAAEDKFYGALLGFREYWHGGMKDNETDWVDMQVPDGTDWLEYMIVAKDAKLSPRVLGILNHVALGVPDLRAVERKLSGRRWKPTEDEHLQVGRDGKRQLNLYDPDGTRIELMEFTPVEKPCCSPYRLPHASERGL